jgi:hypothetical protein
MALNNVLLARLAQIGVKVETDRGTYNAPAYTDAATNDYKILAQNIVMTINQTRYDRDVQWGSLTKYAGVVGKQPVTLSFSVEARRTGTTSTADQWFTLLKGCGYKGTGDSVYALTSIYADMPTLSFEVALGGRGIGANARGMKIKGAVGNVVWSGQVGQPLMANFTFQGVLEEVADVALRDITHETGVPPVFQGINFQYGGAADIAATTFTFDTGNVLAERESINASTGCLHYVITDRRPTGTLDPDLGLEADNASDFFDHMTTNAEKALAFDLAGVCTFSVPKARITAITDGNRNGILTANLTYEAIHTTTDTEVTIDFD